MKMKRKALAWLLTLAMLISSMSFTVFATSKGDNWWLEYVGNPMEDYTIDGVENGAVTSSGSYVLATSDVHRYTYLVKDLLAKANETIAEDGETGNVGLICFGGDFANEKQLYGDNMSILKAAIASSPGTVAAYTKGNHEGDVSDADFEAKVGMSRIGETVKNEDGNYFFYNFGAFNGTQQFTDDDIAALRTYLESLPEDNTKPVFIVSHYPLHYYNDRRSSKNADKVLDLLNEHPEVVFMWGHNHTEQDPNYGMIRVPGDVIQTGAKVDSTKEIRFTYASLGALRDGSNGANGLLIRVNADETVSFRYLAIGAYPDSEDTWTDAQGNDNPVRYTGGGYVSGELNMPIPNDGLFATISLANVQIDVPLVDKLPAEAVKTFSQRFGAENLSWTTDGTAVSGAFDFSTAYTATFTLRAQEGYTFAPDAAVFVNKDYVGPLTNEANGAAQVIVSEDGKTAEVTYTFEETVGLATEEYPAATVLEDGAVYVMASAENNVAASYFYDPAQHGEESMPDYTAGTANVVIRDGMLVSEVSASTVFTAQKDRAKNVMVGQQVVEKNSFLLYSDESAKAYEDVTALNYLNMSTRGGDLGLEAAESLTLPIYCNWQLDETGAPYLDVDGAKKYVTFTGKNFGYVDDSAESNVRLYKVGDSESDTIYHAVVNCAMPQVGLPHGGIDDTSYYGTVGAKELVWTTSDGADFVKFDYDTAYTVTATVYPLNGYHFAEQPYGRINGQPADTVEVREDGAAVLTYTFAPTPAAPGAASTRSAVETDNITSGKKYVIVSEGMAMTSNFVEGCYLGTSPVTVADGKITSKVTPDMIFTLDGNEKDGFKVKGANGYLSAKSVGGTPDTWGFAVTNEPGGAMTFALMEGGDFQVVSTGSSGGAGGPGAPPPPGPATVQSLYWNDNHFNYSPYNKTSVTLYELTMPFTDVGEGRWSANKIEKVADAGIMFGTSETTFGPTEHMTRAMAIATVYRIAGSPAPVGTCSFTDVSEESYYYKAVTWGVENGIVAGTSATKFSPNENVTRQQFASFIGRYLKSLDMKPTGEALSFADAATISSYAVEHIALCTENRIINGFTDNTFRPNELATREQAATMLAALLDVKGSV